MQTVHALQLRPSFKCSVLQPLDLTNSFSKRSTHPINRPRRPAGIAGPLSTPEALLENQDFAEFDRLIQAIQSRDGGLRS